MRSAAAARAIAEVTAASAMTLGLAIAGIIAGIATVGSFMSASTSKAKSSMKDGIIGPGGEMVVSGPKGSIQLDKEDSIIAGTDLGGGKERGGGARRDAALIAKVEQLIAVNQQILAKSPVIEMGGNEVGQGINTAEREIQ